MPTPSLAFAAAAAFSIGTRGCQPWAAGTDRLDLYLLDWCGPVRLELGLPASRAVQTDQVLYNLAQRGIELTLLPWCRARGLAVMAYSSARGTRLGFSPRAESARFPKAGTVAHVRQNRAALDLRLHESDMLRLDEALPPPLTPQPLEIL